MPKPRKHKRGKPKSARAGCLLCKPHKLTGEPKFSIKRKLIDMQ